MQVHIINMSGSIEYSCRVVTEIVKTLWSVPAASCMFLLIITTEMLRIMEFHKHNKAVFENSTTLIVLIIFMF